VTKPLTEAWQRTGYLNSLTVSPHRLFINYTGKEGNWEFWSRDIWQTAP
jgi:hypothetical protein